MAKESICRTSARDPVVNALLGRQLFRLALVDPVRADRPPRFLDPIYLDTADDRRVMAEVIEGYNSVTGVNGQPAFNAFAYVIAGKLLGKVVRP